MWENACPDEQPRHALLRKLDAWLSCQNRWLIACGFGKTKTAAAVFQRTSRLEASSSYCIMLHMDMCVATGGVLGASGSLVSCRSPEFRSFVECVCVCVTVCGGSGSRFIWCKDLIINSQLRWPRACTAKMRAAISTQCT